jgi:hypothetical protein
MRIITLTSVAFASGAFLRWVPFDYMWWYDIAGQLALTTIISLLWRSFSLSRKIGLLIFAFFVGWFTDWVVHAIRFQPDDWVAMKAGVVLLLMRSVFGVLFLIAFHFCLLPSPQHLANKAKEITE